MLAQMISALSKSGKTAEQIRDELNNDWRHLRNTKAQLFFELLDDWGLIDEAEVLEQSDPNEATLLRWKGPLIDWILGNATPEQLHQFRRFLKRTPESIIHCHNGGKQALGPSVVGKAISEIALVSKGLVAAGGGDAAQFEQEALDLTGGRLFGKLTTEQVSDHLLESQQVTLYDFLKSKESLMRAARLAGDKLGLAQIFEDAAAQLRAD